MSSYPPSQPIRGSRAPATVTSPPESSKPLPLPMRNDLERIALLTAYIARGQPLEAMAQIDRLLIAGSTRRDPATAADLRVLRNVAELELARQLGSHQGWGADLENGASGGTIDTILEFADRILPTLQHMGCASRPSSLSEQLAVERCWHEPKEPARDLYPERVLSERQFEVLHLVALGMSNLKIARTLFVSEGTVKKHLSNVFAKLGADNRTEAVALARRRGILD